MNLILVLALTSWPAFARIIRSVVIEARSMSYVEAAYGLGSTKARIARRHLLPATLGVLPTKLILTVRFAVFAEATLAFLDLAGSDSVSWGTMLSHAFNDPLLFSRPVWPWLLLPPMAAIMALILGATWLTTGLGSPAGPAPRFRDGGTLDSTASGRAASSRPARSAPSPSPWRWR